MSQLPPEQVATTAVLQLVFGKMASRAITLVAELGVADLMKDGPVPVDELANAKDVNADALNRVLRVLTAVGVFTETAPRTFGLNIAGQLLRSDVPGSLRGLVLWLGDDTSWRAFEQLRYAVKTGQSAYDKVNGHSLFDYLARTPQVGAIFNAAMTSLTGQFMPAVLAAYDFSGMRRLVDVGGGQGALVAALVEHSPELRGTLMDLPEVVAQAARCWTPAPTVPASTWYRAASSTACRPGRMPTSSSTSSTTGMTRARSPSSATSARPCPPPAGCWWWSPSSPRVPSPCSRSSPTWR